MDSLQRFNCLLSVLQKAGLPILRSLRIIQGDLKKGTELHTALETVCFEIEGGSMLSESLAKCPDVFDRFYVNMIRAGEAGGHLEVLLQRLVTYYKQQFKDELARSLWMLGLLVGAGVPILEALSTVKENCKGEKLANMYQNASDAVRKKKDDQTSVLAMVFKESGVVSGVICNLVDVGEETGELDTMLFVAAELREEDAAEAKE